MSALTPTAHAILTRLTDQPATTDALREHTGRSRTTIDKTLTDLSARGLITQHPGDDGPDRWALTDTGHHALTDLDHDMPSHDAPSDDPHGDDTPTDDTHVDDPARHDETGDETADRSQDNSHGAELPGVQDAPDVSEPTPQQAPDAADGPDGTDETDGPDETVGGSPDPQPPAEQEDEPVKVCRGCRNVIPVVCPTCWQKTTLYCGDCRRALPATRPGAPKEPRILSNGLPQLAPGELERLVRGVFAAHPVPDFAGVVGWTSARLAVHLPGRSVGAINRVLDKLASTGQLTLLGTEPKRYQSVPDPTDATTDATATDASATDATEPGVTGPRHGPGGIHDAVRHPGAHDQ